MTDMRTILRTIWRTASAWQLRKKAMALIQTWYESSQMRTQQYLLVHHPACKVLHKTKGALNTLMYSLTHAPLCRRRKS